MTFSRISFNEIVIDAVIVESGARRPHGCARRHPEKWNEEDHAEQRAPESSVQRARAGHVSQMVRFGFFDPAGQLTVAASYN